MARSSSLAARFAVLTLLFHTVHSTCYFPDGSSDDRQKQCTSGGTSNCCAEGMQCLSNGFCNDARYDNFERVLRGACTDKSWGSGCQQTCTSIWKKGDEAVHYCGDGKACCGRSDSCCGDSSVSKFDFGSPTVIAVAGDSVAQQPQQQPQEQPQQQQDQSNQSQQSQQQQQTQQQSPQTQESPSSTKQEQQQSPQQSSKQDEQKDASSSTKDSNAPSSSKTNAPAPSSSRTPSSSDALSPSRKDDTSTATLDEKDKSSAPATVVTMITGPSTTFASTITSAPADPNATSNVTNNYINSNTTNNTVVIAVGVGVGLLVLLIVLAVAACWWVRRKRKAKQPSMRAQKVAGAAGGHGDVGTEYFEIGGGGGRAEMASVDAGAELDGKKTSRWGRGSGAVFEMEGSRGIELPEVGRESRWGSDEKRV